MIVSDNANLYGSLFEKANAALNFTTDQDKITNIDEYFTCIRRLAEYEYQNETDPIFTILPVNEETFDIDANTRKINIPTSFMAAGIGVKGDEVAEVLYFTVDRYFDTTDLYYKDILVQWKNAEGDEGLSLTVNKSLSFKPGKVTFGWPISHEITKAAGNVQFAVRFYDRFEDSESSYLTYSFSTLTAAVKVNPSLDFEISDEDAISAIIVDRTQRIFDNLKDSAPTGVVNPAAVPVFEDNYELDDIKNLDELTETITINGATKKVFLVKAKIPADAFGAVGNIKYSWTHEDKNGILLGTPEFGDHYIQTNDETRQEKETYYTKLEDGSYIVYVNDFAPGEVYYEKYSYCVPKTAGIYKVTATNVAGRISTASVNDSCLVPYAKAVNYNIEDASIILNKDENGEFIPVTVTYSIAQNDNGTLDYQWKRAEGYSKDDGIISNATLIKDAINKNIEIKELGHYWLIVTNTYNNNSIVCEPPRPIRVTGPAKAPTISNYFVNGNPVTLSDNSIYISTGDKINCIVNAQLSDSIAYQWQQRNKTTGIYENIEGATEAIYTVVGDGSYKCECINIYNEDRNSILSAPFIVDD